MNEEPAPPRDRLVLELVSGHEPIQGTVSADSARSRRFRGWMELVAALEEVRSDGERHPRAAPAAPDEWPAGP